MSFPLFNMIANSMEVIFGNKFIFTLVVISFILILLLVIRIPRIGILMIITPLILVLAGAGISRFMGISGRFDWIPLMLFIIIGILLAIGFFWKMIEG